MRIAQQNTTAIESRPSAPGDQFNFKSLTVGGRLEEVEYSFFLLCVKKYIEVKNHNDWSKWPKSGGHMESNFMINI